MTRFNAALRLCVFAVAAVLLVKQKIQAADSKPASHTFIASISGIVCDGCKSHIKEAFSKLEGVTNVEVAAGSEPGIHSVTITSSSEMLTKEQAIASLGSFAATYTVKTWEKKGS
jgi:copper chaperone CopZ